jgi:hypothetical protein
MYGPSERILKLSFSILMWDLVFSRNLIFGPIKLTSLLIFPKLMASELY